MIKKLFYKTYASRFRSLSQEFEKTLKQIKGLGKEPFLLPFWDKTNKEVEKALLPTPPKDFLNIRELRDTMFVVGDERWLSAQVEFLKKELGRKFGRFTKEENVGSPLLLESPLDFTSHNTIHHLYHIFYFLKRTKTQPSDFKTIVEWGGGYGNFARLWMQHINPASTYIIIDSSLFVSLQWLYLSTIFGEKRVHVVTEPDDIKDGQINLVPIALLKKLNLNADLFVSTWGLSESAKEAQDFVKEKDWFNAKHLLIGFQDSIKKLRYASRLGEIAAKDGATIIDIDFIPNNHYAFK